MKKHLRIPVLKEAEVSGDLLDLCEVDLASLVSSFNKTQDNMALQSKVGMKMISLLVERTMRSIFAQILEALNQRRSQRITIQ